MEGKEGHGFLNGLSRKPERDGIGWHQAAFLMGGCCANQPALQGLLALANLGKGMHPFANPIPTLLEVPRGGLW